jgi:uncharacterized protein (TIGR03437 family)
MLIRGFVLSLIGFCGSAALHAQIPVLPACVTSFGEGSSVGCSVGSSYSFDFGQLFGLEELASTVNGADGLALLYSFTATGNVPTGLTLSSSGLLSGTLAAAGDFNFTLTINLTLDYEGSPLITESIPLPFEFVVTGYTGPQLTVDPQALSFDLTQGGAAVTQSVTIANYGNQAVQFSASATTSSGGNWLQLSSTSGPIASLGSSGLSITADPSKITAGAGTYSGTVTVSIPGEPTAVVSVLAVVSGTQPNIELSQTGATFDAVSGGTATSPQTITVLNPGAGILDFTASASTIAGGDWLSVSPSSGTTSAASAGSVTVSVNSAALPPQPGTYYGEVQFAAPGAVNSPQVASVVLNVVSPANSPGAFVAPTGLIFVGSAGGADPASQNVTITNPSPDALSFLVTPFSNNAANWLDGSPTSGSVSSTQPATIGVQPTLQGLAAGVYIGELAVTFISTSASASSTATPQIYHIEVLLLVLPPGVSPGVRSAPRPRVSSTCAPTQLLPVFTVLGTGFTVNAGWPTAIQVAVVDDCGNPLIDGSVTVTFSSGDPALALESLHNGNWSATWNATHAASSVTITAQAQEVHPALTGSASIGGTLQPNTTTPSVSSGGVVGIFSAGPNQPLAPGGYATIYGTNLSQGTNVAAQVPFGVQLGGTSVILGGKQLPLSYTSGGQVNVVVPYDVPVNTTQQLVVQNGQAISIPQAVVIAAAQPTILSPNGVAYIYVEAPDGTALPPNSAVTAGDTITLYCSGLGAVSPPVAAGSPASSTTLSNTVNPVTAMIGQTPATVLFAGLAPGWVQLYQVNIRIPSGLPSGKAVLTLAVSGQQSAPVSITVK